MRQLERWRVIAPLLLVSAISAWWLRADNNDSEAAIYERPQRVARAQAPVSLEQVVVRPRETQVKTADPFVSRSWYVPPPPPPPPAATPPPPPTAPRLPFSYLGKIEEAANAPVFFLQKGEKLYTVKSGDIVDGIYRVEGDTGGRLRLTYLPMNLAQAVELGGGP